jgi:magnesium chelatase subunit I
MDVIIQEAVPADLEGLQVEVPGYMAEIVATISQLARQSPQVNQRSGVSVRLGVANYETLVASAARRSLRTGEDLAVPRVSDLTALVSSTAGKVELDSLEDDAEDEVVARLTRQAVLAVFRDRVDPADLAKAVAELDDGTAMEVGDDLPSSSYVASLDRLPGLRAPTVKLAGSQSEAALAAAAELVLEGLHLSKRLNKHSTAHGVRYQAKRS